MFVQYLDDSDDKDSPVVTLAGYLTTERNWRVFEHAADGLYNSYGIDLLHAKEFRDTKKQFAGWTLNKKRTFVRELYEIVKSCRISGISQSIHKERWKELKQDKRLPQSMSAYGACFAMLLTDWCQVTGYKEMIKSGGLALCIEDGHKNNAELAEYFEGCKNFDEYSGLRTIEFVAKSSSKAIQLSDFLAFYARRRAADLSRYGRKLIVPRTGIFEQIMNSGFEHRCMWGDEQISVTFEGKLNRRK